MRKFLLGLGLLALAVTPVMAQEATPEATPDVPAAVTAAPIEPWVCPEGFEGQSLSVYNWSTYVAEDTIANFEAACGVTVIYDVFESNEALLARLRQGNPGYDITVPTDYAVEKMIAEGLVVELDHSLIPNLTNISPSLLNLPFDPENRFSVPYQWGTIGIGYNITEVGEEITSWEQVWNYDGPVAWLDDTRAMIGIGLKLLGFDVNTSNPDEIAQARDFLIERGGNVVAIAADDGQARLERGEVDITIEYHGDIFQVIADCECPDYRYIIPSEGSQQWMDNMVIPTDAPNVALAHAFIDYILHPQVGADISNYTAFASPNQAAIDAGLIDAAMLNEPGIYPPAEVLENLFSIIAVPEAEVDYLSAWDEIKVSLGV